MKYKTAAAFRVALEARLLNHSRGTGLPLVRLRKSVAFDRLLARLVFDQPDRWVLKGGYALQLRLEHALNVIPRTTRDVDLQTPLPRASVREALVRAALIDLGDWTQFNVSEPAILPEDEQALWHAAIRFQVEMLLDGRHFETFNVDIGLHDSMIQQADVLALPSLLEFADIPTVRVPCYPLAQHIAEKVHAYTRVYASGPSTRVKDLVDLLLIAELGVALSSSELRQALEKTFTERGSKLPDHLPDPPASWGRSYRELAREVHLRQLSLDDAIDAVRQFIDPLLRQQPGASWSKEQWKWI